MRPERSGARGCKAEQSPNEEDVELTDDVKAVLNILKDNSPIDLDELSGLNHPVGAFFLSPGCHSIYLFDLYPPFSYLS